jgi:hypothetical protein
VTYSDAEFSWLNTIAPTAIVFPYGSALGAAYDDVALVGDANNGSLYRFPLNGTRTGFDFSAFPALVDLIADDASERNLLRIGQGFGIITDLDIGPDGALYVVSLSGNVFRISSGSTPTPTATSTPTNTPAPPPTCAATPELCRTPAIGGKALIVLKDDGTDDSKDSLLWKWIKGAATAKSEFGDPVNAHSYQLCIYDGGGLAAGAAIPFGSAWTERRSGFKFKDSAGSAGGVRTVLLKAGADQKAKVIVRGKGGNLDMPDLAALSSPLTVQLKRAGGAVCWGARYSFPPATRNTAAMFKDKAD